MLQAKITDIYSQGSIIESYGIKFVTGETKRISPKDLNDSIKGKEIRLTNYKMTSDDKLVKKTDKEMFMPESRYMLMNKDKVIADFNLNTEDVVIYGNLPIGFTNIQDWIQSRRKFSCARNISEFFRSIGIESTQDFIDIFHCVSLQDTFWIKRNGSEMNWEAVSPFRNNYSDIIATYALEGIISDQPNKHYFSPVPSTDGTFPHTWKFIDKDTIIFIKAGSKYTLGGSNSGREPFSEYYASKVGEFLGFNCVMYDIRNHVRRDGRVDIITECKCFTTEDIGAISACNLGLDSYEKIIDYCQKLGEKSYKTILDMLFLDCLLLNTDRHFSNIEFLVDNNTQEILEIAPIFDNNYSLLPRFMEGYDTFDSNDYIARDNRTFKELYDLVKSYRSYRKELISLKNFHFKKPDTVDIKQGRLDFLNEFLQNQVEVLL